MTSELVCSRLKLTAKVAQKNTRGKYYLLIDKINMKHKCITRRKDLNTVKQSGCWTQTAQ